MSDLPNAAAERNGWIGFLARHRVAANLVMLLMLFGGVLGLSRMNVQFLPDFALDIVTVRTLYSGASAEDVESGITVPLEQRLRNIDGLKRMTSTSAQGVSSISLEFIEGSDPVLALDDVREQVDSFTNLPTDAEEPRVSRVVNYEPVARVLLYGDVDSEALRKLARRYEDELLADGIDRVDISGLPDQQISVEVPVERLGQLDLTLPEIAERLDGMSVDLPAGMLGQQDGARELRAVEQRRRAEDFADISVLAGTRVRLTLGDIAILRTQARPQQTTLNRDGQPGVELLLQRSESGNALEAAEVLNQWLERTRRELPNSLKLEVHDQSWQLISERIQLLINNGVGGLVLVLGLLYLFLPARVALWVAVGIPTAFLGAMAVFWLGGGSVNMISLFALIMALGVIVDDAIVVGEDADAHWRNGEAPRLASTGAAHRMLWPVVASSLTTVAAFMPLLMVGGPIGSILRDIPLVMICVLIASLLECFVILPAHLRNAFVAGATTSSDNGAGVAASWRRSFDERVDRLRHGSFRRFSAFTLRHRGLTLASAVALVLTMAGLVASGRLAFEFFPTPEPSVVYANASFVTGTPSEQVVAYLDEMNQALEETLDELDEDIVKVAITRQGATLAPGAEARTGDNVGSVMVELTASDHRRTRNREFIRSWREKLPQAAGLDVLSIRERAGGPPGDDVSVRLTGDDAGALKSASEQLAQAMAQIPGVLQPTDDLAWGREQLIYSVNAQGQALGLTTRELGRQLRAAFEGVLVQTFQDGADEVEVRVLLPEHQRERLATLSQLMIRVDDGRLVPVGQIMDITYRQGFDALRHADGRLAVEVSTNLDSEVTTTATVIEALDSSLMPQLVQQYHLNYSYEGQAADQREVFADMQTGLVVGLGLMYAVLAWVFSSWSLPLIVMATIPLALVGAMLGHWVMGLNLTILSLFGLFGLSGIVVNNAIILVSFYRHQRAAGLAINAALEEAVVQRVRAVLLTTLTTIGGLTPLLFETSLQAQFLIPMAVTIAFGLGVSTMLVLAVIPVLLSYLEGWRERFHAVEQAE